ncbi:MAG: pilus assembly protein PilW [Aromatoleum sp.]|nr:pilus assembly protein PilW [Aromatoleum sp.]
MRRQRGATITELMVASTVGMLVMLMATGLLMSANAAYVAQVEAAKVDDGGRYALEVITRAARQAAFVNWERDAANLDQGTAPARIGGLDAHSLNRATDGIDAPLADAVNGSDVLAVRFAGAGDGSVISCAGFAVGEKDDGWSIFYVGRGASGEAELRCKYRGKASWGADAIIGGVDTFQVLYGLDTDSPADGVANEYVSAGVVEERDAALVLTSADPAARERELRRRTHWKRVASIRVALVVHGAKRGQANEKLQKFDLFGSEYSNAFGSADRGVHLAEADLPDDLRPRERRMFASTILLRNAAVEARR